MRRQQLAPLIHDSTSAPRCPRHHATALARCADDSTGSPSLQPPTFLAGSQVAARRRRGRGGGSGAYVSTARVALERSGACILHAIMFVSIDLQKTDKELCTVKIMMDADYNNRFY